MKNKTKLRWTAAEIVRSTKKCPAVANSQRVAAQAQLRRGFFLNVGEIPRSMPPWDVRSGITKARAIATMLARRSSDTDALPAAITMESALIMRGIWTWSSAPNIRFWPTDTGGRSKSNLPEVWVNGVCVPRATAAPLTGVRLGEIPDLIGGVPVVTADEAVIDLGRYGDPLSAWVGATALFAAGDPAGALGDWSA